MSAGVGHLVHLGDDAVGVDEEGHALRKIWILLVRASRDSVRVTDAAIDVGEQSIAELFVRRERVVVRRRVERRADDGGAEFVELLASITEALAFACSTTGRGLGVPPQHDP